MSAELKIGIADDNDERRRSLTKEVSKKINPDNIYHLRNIEDLQEKLKTNKLDLIICGEKFFGKTSLDLLYLIKNIHSGIPIIITGESQSKYVFDNFIKLGATCYLSTQELNKLSIVIESIRDRLVKASTDKFGLRDVLISPQVFEAFFGDAPIGVCITSPEGKLQYVNKSLAKMLNYEKEELIGKHFASITHPDDIQKSKEFAKSLLEGKETTGILEKRYLTKNGEAVWAYVSSTLIKDRNEPLCFMTRIIDITEKKAIELKLRQQAEIIDDVDIVIALIDKQDVFRFWNKGAEKVTGWNGQEILGKSMDDIRLIEETDWYKIGKELESKGTFFGIIHGFDKKGNKKIWESKIIVWNKEDIKEQKIILTLLDITEEKKMEEQFLREQRLDTVGMLASGIAHDLNNCLTPTTMGIDLLKLRTTDENCLKILNSMEKSINKALEMVKQILAFTRGMGGESAPVNMNVIINDIKNIIQNTFPQNIRINVKKQENLWNVIGNTTRLHQAIMNLCVNARDAMPQGGALSITTSNVYLSEQDVKGFEKAKPGHYIVVKVADTGCGISPEHLPSIFEPFFSTKETGKGTGLGLYVVKTIVTEHNGFITVSSKPREGTQFDIYFPADPKAVEKEMQKKAAKMPKGNGQTILLIEDEEYVRAVAKAALESANFKVYEASDGAEGVYMALNHKSEIELIITDMSCL
ncbi:MAG: PAS domain S-box protein [Verrucomicrobiia bacterium]